MKTKQMVILEYGKADIFQQKYFDLPELKEGQILIDQFSTSINPIDIKIRSGQLKFITGRRFPKILGADFCGKVKQSRDPSFNIGDEVFGILDIMKGGAYSEQIILNNKYCILKPSHLTIYEAGVIAVVGLTCYEAIIIHGNIQKESKVFINGCTGGVGSFAVKIAKAIGAEVTGTCSQANINFAKEIGVNTVLDYNKMKINDINSPFDIVFDTTGKWKSNELKMLGDKKTKYATTGFNIRLLMSSIFNKNIKRINVTPNFVKLKKLKDFLEKNQIKPIITREWTLDNISSAHNEYENNRPVGKILIKIQ